jgi:hypothetical protein
VYQRDNRFSPTPLTPWDLVLAGLGLVEKELRGIIDRDTEEHRTFLNPAGREPGAVWRPPGFFKQVKQDGGLERADETMFLSEAGGKLAEEISNHIGKIHCGELIGHVAMLDVLGRVLWYRRPNEESEPDFVGDVGMYKLVDDFEDWRKDQKGNPAELIKKIKGFVDTVVRWSGIIRCVLHRGGELTDPDLTVFGLADRLDTTARAKAKARRRRARKRKRGAGSSRRSAGSSARCLLQPGSTRCCASTTPPPTPRPPPTSVSSGWSSCSLQTPWRCSTWSTRTRSSSSTSACRRSTTSTALLSSRPS